MDACHCKDYTRAAILRQTAARAGAGAGLRAIEPGMPLPAGTGLSRRSFLARSSGLALAVFGGGALAPSAFDEGIADAMGAARAEHRARLHLPLRRPGHARAARAGRRPDVPAAAPDAQAGPEPGERAGGRPAAAVASVRARRSRRCTRPAGSRSCPAIGYSTPNQSHFTSRHFYEVGELNESGQVGWLGRWLDRNGRADNPLQGLSMDATLAPALAAANDAGRRRRLADELRAQHGRRRPRCGRAMNQAYGALGRLATSRPGARLGARRRRAGRRDPGQPGAALRQGDHRRARRRRRTRPTAASRTSSRRWRRCCTWACRSAASRSTATAATTRTTTRPRR